MADWGWGAEDDFAFAAAYGGGDDAVAALSESSSAVIAAAFTEQVTLRKVSTAELALHNAPNDCWVALHGKVYDLTKFAKEHIGGPDSITRLAGTDGTDAFGRKHGPNVLNSLTLDVTVGELDTSISDSEVVQHTSAVEARHNEDSVDLPKSVVQNQDTVHTIKQDDHWVVLDGKVVDTEAGQKTITLPSPPAKRLKADASEVAIVVGGGLSGVTAANTVVECGGKVMLLEKAAFCGGNSTKATSGINGAGTEAQKNAGR
jgi:cytochrome b involved in lipid metabolism